MIVPPIFVPYMKRIFGIVFICCMMISAWCQDSTHPAKLSFHVQATNVTQYHFDFPASYTGNNSLLPSEDAKASFTTTLSLCYKPFKNTYLVFNPEAAAGKGLSKTLGMAGFPNGEVYRVGDPNISPFIARLYFEQRFPLSNRKEKVEDDANAIAETTNKDYISVIAGKFSLLDLFDNSDISHDPRTQFLNWSLMGSGAWDYPANTRGYTFGVALQVYLHDWVFRLAHTAVPIEANGQELQYKGSDASGSVFEIEKDNLFKKDEKHFTNMHAGIYINKARMGNYQTSINKALPILMAPDITSTREYGRTKWGYYIAMETNADKVHHFAKGSWNDGNNESWAFTEIDQSFATGLKFDGEIWSRKKDHAGIAFVANGLSDIHKKYLSLGGYGFLIGDGKLNYGMEQTLEAYYSWNVWKKLFITPDYQFVTNPAYNKDRGPVHIIALRLHVEL